MEPNFLEQLCQCKYQCVEEFMIEQINYLLLTAKTKNKKRFQGKLNINNTFCLIKNLIE